MRIAAQQTQCFLWLFSLVCILLHRAHSAPSADGDSLDRSFASAPQEEERRREQATEEDVSITIIKKGELYGSDCFLDCLNGGECRLGRTGDGTDSSSSPSSGGAKQGHYCFCPTGFTGIYCEIKFVLCHDASETCFNGEPCRRGLDDRGAPYYHCECDTDPSVSHLDTPEAGRFCAYSAMTTYCSSDRSREGPYCANSGKCNPDGSTCTCPPTWTGEHCHVPVNLEALYEAGGFFRDNVADSQQPADGTSDKNRVAYVSLVILLGTFLSIFLVMRHYGASLGPQGRIRLRTEEPETNGVTSKRRPHPMEMEMKHMSAPSRPTGLRPTEVV